MTIQNLERATNIQSRLKELRKIKEWCEDKTSTNIYILASSTCMNNSIIVSDTMRDEIHSRCIAEMDELQAEFEKL